jgi:hypothetical protein
VGSFGAISFKSYGAIKKSSWLSSFFDFLGFLHRYEGGISTCLSL